MKWPYYILTALYCAGIFCLSSQSKPVPVDMHFPAADKLAHALVYAGLCALVSVGIRRSGRHIARGIHLTVPVAFAFLYGVTDELHQLFVPQRTFELMDLAADAAGAVTAQALLFLRWREKKG